MKISLSGISNQIYVESSPLEAEWQIFIVWEDRQSLSAHLKLYTLHIRTDSASLRFSCSVNMSGDKTEPSIKGVDLYSWTVHKGLQL